MSMICNCPVLYVRDVRSSDSYSPVRLSASRGRNPSFPKKRARSGETFVQFVELGSGVVTNTITSVSKDNWLWIEKDL